MAEFKQFKKAIADQFVKLSRLPLFRVNVTKYELWDLYLNSFPEGTNPIYKERTEYDCQCCKQFIRAIGDVVAIVDNKLVSIWDVKTEGEFQVVADALSSLVKSKTVINIFLHYEKSAGTDFNYQTIGEDTIKWEHFHCDIPSKFVNRDPGSILSDAESNKGVLKRSLEELSLYSAETILELISQGSLYRGDENKSIVELFARKKREYDVLPDDEKDNYCWVTSLELKGVSKIRNTSIGTLMVDISSGMELEDAVKKFEAMVAPSNYKRPTALITKTMITNAQKKVEELGIKDSFERRYAVMSDITVNNTIYVDREVKPKLSIFDEMVSTLPENVKKIDKVEEVDIDTFLNNIVPKAQKIELMVENKHSSNLMSLFAPVHLDSKNIFKWDNNFSWSYNGEVADSIKERVKKAGGNVNGVLRFSIQWNHVDLNRNDFDAHCTEPSGHEIYYANKINHNTTGFLDIDIIHPDSGVPAVENIAWTDVNKMKQGNYIFRVHNFSDRGGMSGFSAEIEFDGKIFYFEYPHKIKSGEFVNVATVNLSKDKVFEIKESLQSTVSSKSIWGLNTQTYAKVSMIMKSPNHWDGQESGNKHIFFILEGCKNPDPGRGFYNEFLRNDLNEHRKVFEVLASKLKAEPTDDQLSGVGFSSTQRNEILCKVTSNFKRIIKLKF